MAPRVERVTIDDDDDDILDDDEDLDEEDEKPKKKKAATSSAKKRPAPKKEADGDETKPKKPRAKKLKGPEVDELGWMCVPPGLIYRDFNTKPSKKIAAFDADGTLVLTKSGADFARGPDDWRFITKQVPTTLKDLHNQGYKIVVFSNQGAVKSALTGKAAATAKGKLEQMLKQAGVPALVMFATMQDEYRKPGTGMWDYMTQHLSGGVEPDKSSSFYVGDAAGRPTDFVDKSKGGPSDVDKQFAAAVGIEFKLPETLFGEAAGKGGGNKELVDIFKELADHLFSTGVDKDKWRALSCKKVAAALSGFEDKIEAHNLKAVNALAGVGKGSMAVISEWVTTGKVQEVEDIRAKKQGGDAAGSGSVSGEAAAGAAPAGTSGETAAEAAAPKSAAAAVALKFM